MVPRPSVLFAAILALASAAACMSVGPETFKVGSCVDVTIGTEAESMTLVPCDGPFDFVILAYREGECPRDTLETFDVGPVPDGGPPQTFCLGAPPLPSALGSPGA